MSTLFPLSTSESAASLAPGMTFLRLLGVDYVHLVPADGGDLYVTEYGMPYLQHLKPENWYAAEWFSAHRTPLQGTGTVYRLPTRPIEGHTRKSIELVVKWSRVGQDVPLDTFMLSQAINADFNSPFEEFSLVHELRAAGFGKAKPRIHTQKPMAIYVPPERMQLWQTGRSRYKVLTKVSRHASVEIDILRSYIMIYGWVKGIDAVEAGQRGLLGGPAQAALRELTLRVMDELQEKGFAVADHKPTHAILRVSGDRLLRRRSGKLAYAIVDYELLARTPAHEGAVRAAGRSRYLLLQRNRFDPPEKPAIPSHLKLTELLGVDYVFGRAESTGGSLWVVGKDPRLVEYFLPERWRSRQIALSASGRTWYVRTKDAVHLVWKVSRVGDLPQGPAGDPRNVSMRGHGYNSPFEKFALALELSRLGVPCVCPRAIYVTAQRSGGARRAHDVRRYRQYKDTLGPDGQPILQLGPDYVTIWGYWRGSDDKAAPDAQSYWSPIGAGQAHVKGLLSDEELSHLLSRHAKTLEAAGHEDLNLEPDHLLLSYVPGGAFKRTRTDEIEVLHCNFEMVRKIGSTAS